MTSLSASWSRRLEAAQLDFSWQAQLEARVLRFLLSRYNGANAEPSLPDCPLFQGEAPHGRAKLPLSPRQLRSRLDHITRVGLERPLETQRGLDSVIEQHAYEEFLLRRKEEESLWRRRNEARRSIEDKPLTKVITLRLAEILWVFIALLALYFLFSSSGL